MCNFCELTRAYSLPMSISAFLVPFCAAHKLMPADFWLNSVIVLASIVLLHLAGNLYDDYRDVASYIEKGINPNDINFKNDMKARLILNGTYTLPKVKNIIAALLVIPALAAVYFCFTRGLNILWFVIPAILLAAFYPKSAKCGLQEVAIGLLFGPLLVCGTYYAFMGYFSLRMYNFSMAIGIFTSILLITHGLMDYEYDVASGKKTLPVLLKNKYLTINLILVLILLGLGIYIYTKLDYCMSFVFYIPVICVIPVARKLLSSLKDYIEIRDVKFEPKWYHGIMENWDQIKNTGAQYFMYRFYLARNLSLIFNVTLALCLYFAFDPIRDKFFMDLKLIMRGFGF